jgi:hypothetical protein
MLTLHDSQPASISAEFAARLDRLHASQKVRALVLLQTAANGAAPTTRKERQQRVERLRNAARASLPEIDRLLACYQGKRLSEDVDALGSITVEAAAEGIRALAESEQVKAILEDQSILSRP